MRLTEAQRIMLIRAAIHTLADNSGTGAPILDGIQARTADRLETLTLVRRTRPHGGYEFGFARITPAGRLALTSGRERG